MTHIFLSYNREDQARAKLFAEAFEAQGFKVWWDVGRRTTDSDGEVTETALRTAKAKDLRHRGLKDVFNGLLFHRKQRAGAHHGGPFAHAPALNDAVQNVGIGRREGFDGFARGRAKQQHRAIHRRVQGPGQQQFPACHRRAYQFQMRGPMLWPPFGISLICFIEE